MTDVAPIVLAASDRRTIPRRLTLLLAAACGLIVANPYYAQPLAGPIDVALGLPPAATGLIMTLTQIGYGAGLLMIVPLGDLLENRGLAVTMVGIAMLALDCLGLRAIPRPSWRPLCCWVSAPSLSRCWCHWLRIRLRRRSAAERCGT